MSRGRTREGRGTYRARNTTAASSDEDDIVLVVSGLGKWGHSDDCGGGESSCDLQRRVRHCIRKASADGGPGRV